MRFLVHIKLVMMSLLFATNLALAHSQSMMCDQHAGEPPSPDHQTKKDDIWPWPWGTECPFNWTDIEGRWELVGESLKNYFEFEVLSVTEEGSRYFEIRRYDENGVLFSIGNGYSNPGEKIVRAAMYQYKEGKERGEVYWVIVRWYKKDKETSCRSKSQVTAITIRPQLDREDNQSHYVIHKVNDFEEKHH